MGQEGATLAEEKGEKQQRESIYVGEGCCPNRHGPLVRLKKNLAACRFCKFVLRGSRVEDIFGPEEGKG